MIQLFHNRELVCYCLNRHIINGCQFTKNMSGAQVETRIVEVFDGKIPNLVDIELLMSVHNALVIPNLAPDQKGIDGVIVHRLFKNKPVYIRPSCELLNFTERQITGRPISGCTCCHHNMYNILKGWQLPNGF